MIDPDQGEIIFGGKNLTDIDPIILRRMVVMLGQEPVIFDGDLRQNVNIGRAFSEKEPLSDERLKRLLKIVRLHKNLEDDPMTFSGGEKQRAAIARILAMEADVYLLDEPTSALDEETELDVLTSVVQEMKEQNRTIVMVTHSTEAAKAVSDHIITLFKAGDSA
jgi:putative ABC transport system ATP-binding protein